MRLAMNKRVTDELPSVIEPIKSLINKSQKAQAKLTPGTWQHTMLHENLQALELAFALMSGRTNGADVPLREDFRAALRAFDKMTTKSARARKKFPPGTSHHTWQRNRLKAFRVAKALIKRQRTRPVGLKTQ